MDLNKLTSTHVPTHLLYAGYLIGKVPFRASQKDPRVSYALYVPPQAYKEVHQALRSKEQDHAVKRLKLVVNVHGTRRDASACRESLIAFADKHGVAILAPYFPAAIEGPMDLDSYKALRSKTLKADEVLLSILDEVARIWTGIETEKFTILGFSGGAQFTQRFLYLYPERIAAAIVAAPGRSTMISDKAWPKGTGDVSTVFPGRSLDLEAIKKIDLHLLVGEEDTKPDDQVELLHWAAKKGLKALDPEERAKELEAGRVESLKGLQMNWREHGIEAELEIVPGFGHDYVGLVPAMVKLLEGCIERRS